MASVASAAPAVRPKPRLTFWEIWNMSFGFLGIQIGFALQNANVSRIFETLGAKVEDIPILWIAAPVTGPSTRVRQAGAIAIFSSALLASCVSRAALRSPVA